MSLRIRELPSPNHDDRPGGAPIDMLILHYTGMHCEEAIERLRDPAPPTGKLVSSHYVVEEDGLHLAAGSGRRSAPGTPGLSWCGRNALNGCSIGIELVNPGHEFGHPTGHPPDRRVVRPLPRHLLPARVFPPCNVVGHGDVAPDRKQDPGELFEWEALAQSGVGLWPEGVPDLGREGAIRDAAGLRDVRRALANIGYKVAPEGALDPALASVLRAFQRHWRPEAITGQADGERSAVCSPSRGWFGRVSIDGLKRTGVARPGQGSREWNAHIPPLPPGAARRERVG